MCSSGTQKVKLHPNKPPTFLLSYAITNEKTVKFMQVDRLLSASKTSLADFSSRRLLIYNILNISNLHGTGE